MPLVHYRISMMLLRHRCFQLFSKISDILSRTIDLSLAKHLRRGIVTWHSNNGVITCFATVFLLYYLVVIKKSSLITVADYWVIDYLPFLCLTSPADAPVFFTGWIGSCWSYWSRWYSRHSCEWKLHHLIGCHFEKNAFAVELMFFPSCDVTSSERK